MCVGANILPGPTFTTQMTVDWANKHFARGIYDMIACLGSHAILDNKGCVMSDANGALLQLLQQSKEYFSDTHGTLLSTHTAGQPGLLRYVVSDRSLHAKRFTFDMTACLGAHATLDNQGCGKSEVYGAQLQLVLQSNEHSYAQLLA